MYGPQTEKIERILTQLRNLTPAQAQALGDAWDPNQIDAWAIARVAALGATRDATWDAMCDAARGLTSNARGAAWDAILALLAQDKISSRHFDTLYGPWKSVME